MTQRPDETTSVTEATERAQYAVFRREYTARRITDIGKMVVNLSGAQLPTGSVLHILDGLETMAPTAAMPNPDSPLLKNEANLVYLNHTMQVADKNAPHGLGVTQRHRFAAQRYMRQIMSFHQIHGQGLRRAKDVNVGLANAQALVAINHNTLNGVHVTGPMAEFNKFDIVLRTVLSKVAEIAASHPLRHQYIQVPLTQTVYSRQQYLRPMEKFTRTTIKSTDPTYFFMIHLLGLVNENSVTSLFKHLPETILERVNVILTCGREAVIYNLSDLVTFSGQRKRFHEHLRRHVALLKFRAQNIGKSDMSDDEIEQLEEKHAVADEEPAAANIDTEDQIPEEDPELTTAPSDAATAVSFQPISSTTEKPRTTPDLPILLETQITDLERAQVDMQEAIQTYSKPLTENQKAAAMRRVENFKNLTVGGRPLSELLMDRDVEDSASRSKLDALKGQIPDESMLMSSVSGMDKTYLRNQMNRDIASVLTSFVGVGIVPIEIKETDDITEFNATKTYAVVFADLEGRKHRATFTLPIVNDQGVMTINGVASRMVKQQTALPITKVSESRVSLVSNLNKALVERTTAVSKRFDVHVKRVVSKMLDAELIRVTFGSVNIPDKVPYDYSALASVYTDMTIGGYRFIFDYGNRLGKRPEGATEALSYDERSNLEKTYNGIYCGTRGKHALVYGYDNVIRTIDSVEGVKEAFTLMELFHKECGDKISIPQPPAEWTELKLLSENFPIAFVLGYRFGINKTLDLIGHPYRTVPAGKRATYGPDEISIQFADCKLIFPRYPLGGSLILAGLSRFNWSQYEISLLDSDDVYYTVLSESKSSTNYLKGIRDFFDMFVDPITRDVLRRMGEPTTPSGLLLRATEMLTTTKHLPAASMANHRIRGYERFADTVYNELARGFAQHRSSRAAKTFSLNPQAVFLSIIQDQSVQPEEQINPIHEQKMMSLTTYGGRGGRMARSFVVPDRVYPPDAVGVLSEATPDSGKVSFNAYLSADPAVTNVRGMYTTEGRALKPANVLSTAALLIPGATQDDAKRISYISIQLSHHMPNLDGEAARIRTGYERVLAHRSGANFAYAAEADGHVVKIDNSQNLLRIEYKAEPIKVDTNIKTNHPKSAVQMAMAPKGILYHTILKSTRMQYGSDKIFSVNGLGQFRIADAFTFEAVDDIPDKSSLTPDDVRKLADAGEDVLYLRLVPVLQDYMARVDVIQFGDVFTRSSGHYIKQPIAITVSEGDTFKAGDILAYNAGFFTPDPDTRQVDWKHGVMANVAIIDRSVTYEDSCEISEAFSHKLKTPSGHVRAIEVTNDTAISKVVGLGDQVEVTSPLMVLEDSDLDAIGTGDDTAIELLQSLNQKIPLAKYHGTIVEIAIYHTCPFSELSPSLQTLARAVAKRRTQKHAAMKGSRKANSVPLPAAIPVGTRYGGVDFANDKVVGIFITISRDLECGVGDKVVLAAQAKTVIGSVVSNPTVTESGEEIDMSFAASGLHNRILQSHLIMGVGEKTLIALEDDIVSDYFG
jgi:hypothetical protein